MDNLTGKRTLCDCTDVCKHPPPVEPERPAVEVHGRGYVFFLGFALAAVVLGITVGVLIELFP